MNKNKKEINKKIIKLKLKLRLNNLFLFNQGNLIFNLLVGSLNVGIWVFFIDLKFLFFK